MEHLTIEQEGSAELEKYVRLAQKGDSEAFSRIIELTQDRLYRFCFYLTRNSSLAQDICQDTYLKVLEKIGSLREPNRCLSWLFRMAKNLFLDHVKRKKPDTVATTETLDYWMSAGAEHPLKDFTLKVRDCLGTLSAEERVVILLVDLEGYSYGEAAEIIGISENALRSRLHRARASFGTEFSKDETNQGSGSSSPRESKK